MGFAIISWQKVREAARSGDRRMYRKALSLALARTLVSVVAVIALIAHLTHT